MTEVYISTHLSKVINEVIVVYSATAQIVRPQPDYTYDSMPGMKKTFLFQPVWEGVTLMRAYSCWCDACMRAWAPGEGSMDSNYVCNGCESAQLTWQERFIGRADAAGISNSRQRSQNKARSLAQQLQAHFEKTNRPLWVVVQNRGEDDLDQCASCPCPTTRVACERSLT